MTIFHSIFQMLPQPLAVVSWEGETARFRHANEAFVRLTGLTVDELRRSCPQQIFSSRNDGDRLRPGTAGACSCNLEPSGTGRTVRLRLTWSPIDHAGKSDLLINAQDTSAKSWIDSIAATREVLYSGIVNADFVIDRFERQIPIRLVDIPIEHESAFAFFNENEVVLLRRMLKRIADRRHEETIVLQTKKLGDSVQFEAEMTICPFYDGDGSLKQYGFVITSLRPVEESADPSVTLKILMAKNGISAQQLSEATGISLQTISKLRNGKINKPQRLTAELIAAELNVVPTLIWPRS
jgi:DNA-binding Xre family transcriptional regulator